jgi:diguanylate cyclase (GGDEF)-like protein
VNWTELPDLAAVALLAGAFASVARRGNTAVYKVWLTGWLVIVLHFAAFLFLTAPGIWGKVAESVGLIALTWAGILFMWASVPFRRRRSSRWIFAALLLTNTLYIPLVTGCLRAGWALVPVSILFGALPLVIALATVRKLNHPLRWTLVALYAGLSIFLLIFQRQPGSSDALGLDAVLFTVYFGCAIHFWYAYRRVTTGAFITISGFLAWASVFVIAPLMAAHWPAIQVESEVWNLPKYVVAVGMILLLLEDQIEHNRHLALHDYLTGLPNRRLFEDRLSGALERARRAEATAALLVIDLDRFKHVNDTLGHPVGDLLLKRVAQLFSGRVRRTDTVARTGGDEFSVILEEPTSRENAIQVGRSLMHILQEPLQLGKHTVQVGASIGMAIFPDDGADMESLCVAADARMYDEKTLRAKAVDANPANRIVQPVKPASIFRH